MGLKQGERLQEVSEQPGPPLWDGVCGYRAGGREAANVPEEPAVLEVDGNVEMSPGLQVNSRGRTPRVLG